MEVRITTEVEAGWSTRRRKEWEQRTQRVYENNPKDLEASMDLAVKDAEERFGLSSGEAQVLRQLKHDLTK